MPFMLTMMYQRMMGSMGTPCAAMMGASSGMGVINPMAADAGGGMRLGMSPIGMADTAAGMGGIGGGVTGMGDAAAAGAGAAGRSEEHTSELQSPC